MVFFVGALFFQILSSDGHAQGSVSVSVSEITKTSAKVAASLDDYRYNYRTNGAAIYRIRARILDWGSSDPDYTYINNLGSDNAAWLAINFMQVTGLRPGTTYKLFGWAERTDNNGVSWSNDGGLADVSFTTLFNPPSAPSLTRLEGSDTSITTVFNHSASGPVDSYKIQYSSNNGSSWSTYDTGNIGTWISGASTSHSFPADGNRIYLVRVAGSNNGGTGSYSGSMEIITMPRAPGNVRATTTTTTATVTWSAPPQHGNAIRLRGGLLIEWRRLLERNQHRYGNPANLHRARGGHPLHLPRGGHWDLWRTQLSGDRGRKDPALSPQPSYEP